eukprot:TRINITY_DN6430_c1_g1_i1.p2 TRINITY_DN6430_c1_g1~~TRINITY_DN6430_c1_g1_i1.p2  ORF type:complete len:159 (-),score=13.96 TRINITY_DN6430_c1_g1_i1:346-822(-)
MPANVVIGFVIVLLSLCIDINSREYGISSSRKLMQDMIVGRTDVSIQELYALLQNGSIDIMLDVRTPLEYAAGHIACAQNEPVQTLEAVILSGEYEDYRNKTIGVICSAGFRSNIAAGIFEEQGFESIVNTMQGMSAWITAGLPYIVTEQAEQDACEQ